MKIASYIFLLLVTMSCQNNERKQIEQLVKEWTNREILLPEGLVFTRFATDTVSYTIPPAKHKVIIFVDSVGCISCKLQLPKWRNLINEVDSLSDIDIPFLFFFQTKDVRTVSLILRREGFSYPVCIDTADNLYKLNHFPGNMMFHTFLVDANNRVKVIGNPIHNLLVKDLYLKEISGIKSTTWPVTVIQSDSMEYHYGVIGEDGTVEKKVILYNIGKDTFRIKGVTTSCDCMTVKYGWDEIRPDESALLTVNYKAEEPGDFWRTITIYGNVSDKSITLDFYGTVRTGDGKEKWGNR